MTQIKSTYIDHMGSDLSVVNSARVSFGKHHDEMTAGDSKLIHYLAEHGHYSPFGHCFASFHIKAPVFVARQFVKHKFLRWNEISRRYVDSDPEFYKPELREATKDKKQGSGGPMFMDSARVSWGDCSSHWLKGYHSTLDSIIQQSGIEAAKQYKHLLKMGVCEEQARVVLPLNHMTEWYWSGSLDAFANMCNLRCKSDTQLETRLAADQISKTMAELFPVSWAALTEDK